MPGETADLSQGYIPSAQVFDIDVIADLSSPMKHMLPSAVVFEAAVSKMGIIPSDTVIVYDRHGIRAAPRLWWTFRMFGHEHVAILDGGLPGWIAAGHKTSPTPSSAKPSRYDASPSLSSVTSKADILSLLDHNPQILDARPAGRFNGTTPEPRAGLRSGHIPGSQSWPLSELINSGHLRPVEEIRTQIEALDIDMSKPIITTCGSGITAAGLAFALHLLDAENVSVYDGSWTEWGASDAPISLD